MFDIVTNINRFPSQAMHIVCIQASSRIYQPGARSCLVLPMHEEDVGAVGGGGGETSCSGPLSLDGRLICIRSILKYHHFPYSVYGVISTLPPLHLTNAHPC